MNHIQKSLNLCLPFFCGTWTQGFFPPKVFAKKCNLQNLKYKLHSLLIIFSPILSNYKVFHFVEHFLQLQRIVFQQKVIDTDSGYTRFIPCYRGFFSQYNNFLE